MGVSHGHVVVRWLLAQVHHKQIGAGLLSIRRGPLRIFPLPTQHVDCHVRQIAGVVYATVVGAFPFKP